MKKKKNIFNKKIDLGKTIKPYGFLFGTCIGAVIGLFISLIFKMDLAFVLGIFPGMLIGLLFDVKNIKNRNKKSRKK